MTVEVSVVCPFYNEGQIVEQAVRTLVARLASLPRSWELIVVDDGSRDESRAVVEALRLEFPQLRVVGYSRNRGRGYALRRGIAEARGDVVVTTEIDLSWGEDVVHRLVTAMADWPDADIVVASPHLPGGGYRNVPFKRVFLSKFGNLVVRVCMAGAASMNTGMTRAYRRDVIQSLPLHEHRKEFHLEVILKAAGLGYRIREIPCLLEWKEYKHQGRRVERKSSSKVKKLIVSHTSFSLFASPVRYVWGMSLASLGVGFGFMLWAVYLLLNQRVSAFSALLGLSMVILGILLFVIGLVLQQGNTVQRELWLLQRNQTHDGRARAQEAVSRPGVVSPSGGRNRAHAADEPVPDALTPEPLPTKQETGDDASLETAPESRLPGHDVTRTA